MAVPKQRTSGSKRRSRHAQWKNKLENPAVSQCDNCGSFGRPHRVCMSCGYYRGRKVLDLSGKRAES